MVTLSPENSQETSWISRVATAVLRRIASSILQQDTWVKGTIRAKRKQAGWSSQILEQLLAGFFRESRA
jgi:hypothetical protein